MSSKYEALDSERTNNSKVKVVMVHGNFNILHPGHIRFLRFAREQGDKLIVALYSQDSSEGAFLSDAERHEALQAVSFVDKICVVDINSVNSLIQELKPDVIVKGKEHEKLESQEGAILASYGGKLVFGSGEITRSTSVDINTQPKPSQKFQFSDNYKVHAYLKRHNLDKSALITTISNFSKLKIAVFGDIIVDEYVDCSTVGISKEDPTIVVSPVNSRTFLGGAGIVAAHAKSLGADVDFYSVVGNDQNGEFACNSARRSGVNPIIQIDSTRPTTTKKRYRSSDKTLLRVNDFRQHDIPHEIRSEMLEVFNSKAKDYDLLIFSDFNYGFLCNGFLHNLIKKGQELNIKMVADSQSSSQMGDLAKFRGVSLISPTEYEARLTLHNSRDGLIQLSERLGEGMEVEHVLVTLAEDGVLIRDKNVDKGWWDTDELPALNTKCIDVSGAGDAMMTVASMSLTVGADLWQAALIASFASAVQVSRTGNIPITTTELQVAIEGNIS